MSYILKNTATFPREQLQLAFHKSHSKEDLVNNKSTFQKKKKNSFLRMSDQYNTMNALKLIHSHYKRHVSADDNGHHQAVIK